MEEKLDYSGGEKDEGAYIVLPPKIDLKEWVGDKSEQEILEDIKTLLNDSEDSEVK